MRSARRPEVNRAVAPGVGLSCWVLIHGSLIPWWPVRIVDRNEYQEISIHLAPASGNNVMVQFFGPQQRFDVVELVDVCEYTTNLHLVHQNGRRDDFLSACRDANQFILTQGTPEQKARFSAATPFDELIKPPQKRARTNANSSASDPAHRPAKKRNFHNHINAEPNNSAHTSAQAQDEPDDDGITAVSEMKNIDDAANIVTKQPPSDTNATKITQLSVEKGEPPRSDLITERKQMEVEVDETDACMKENLTKNKQVHSVEEAPIMKDIQMEVDEGAPNKKGKKAQKATPKVKERRSVRKRRKVGALVAKTEDKTMTTTVDIDLYDDETRDMVENLVNGSRFVRDSVNVRIPKSFELRTVNRLLLHGLRNLYLRSSDTTVPNDGKKVALLGCIEDVRRGCIMVDTILTAKNPDIKQLRMTTRLVTIGMLALRDEIGGTPNCTN